MNQEVKAVDPKEVSKLANEWKKAKSALVKAQAIESAARAALVAAAFPGGLEEGTNTHALGGQWKLKISGTVNRKIDEASVSAVLERIKEKHGIDVSNIVRYRPELAVGEYKKLDDKVRRIFDNALTITEGSPQVKIEEAKSKR